MRGKWTAVLTFVSVAGTVAAQADLDNLHPDPRLGCKRNPEVVADCFKVHGRLFVANGTPGLRMWHVGTRRHFGVVPSEAPIVPDNVSRHLGPDRSIYGDFVVCPVAKEKPGSMLMTCIQEAANLVIEEYDSSGEPVRVSIDRSRGEVP